MRLVSIELNNIFRFKKFKCEFHHGSVAITGPNGIGKSNLLRSIRWTLFGDLGGYCKQADIICQGADPDSEGFASLLIQHGSTFARVNRTVSHKVGRSSRKLICGDQVLIRDSDIQDFVEAWVGLSAQAAPQHVFVGQDEALTAFLKMVPAKRAEYLQRLFRLDHAEKCRQVVIKQLSSMDRLPVVDVDSIKSRVIEISSRVEVVKERLALTPVINHSQLEYAREQLAAMSRRRQLLATEIDLIDKTHEASSRFDAISDELNSFTHESDNITDLLKKMPDRDSILAKIASYETRERYEVDINKIESELQLLYHLQTSDTSPGITTCWDESDDYKRTKLVDEKNQLVKFINTFDSDNKLATCPTCGTSTDTLLTKISDSKRFLLATDKELIELDHRFVRFTNSYDKHIEWCKRKNQRDAEILKHQVHIDDLMKHMPLLPESSLKDLCLACDEYRRLLSSNEKLYDLINSIRKDYYESKSNKESLENQLIIVKGSIKELPEELPNEPAARAVLIEMEKSNSDRARLEGELSALSVSLDMANADLVKATKESERSQVLEAWKPDLESLRDALHWEATPRRVAWHRLEALTDEVNSILADLHIDFRVNCEADLGFRARFPDGRKVPASMLSGGESACLAIAWHLAVNSGAGFLCLDEPTAGLDRDRLGYLANALKNLKSVSSGRGLQCVIVTHERSILGVFDQVIDLATTPSNCQQLV